MVSDSQTDARYYRGWARPGPDVPGAGSPDPDSETLDALSGKFRIFQLKRGHRYSTDDVLTAWYGTLVAPTAHRVLDLGSGIGSVAMIAAWRFPGAKFVTVEAQDISVALARRSARYNGLETRFDIRCGDMRDPEILHADERFDLILGSPPYFPLDAGLHGDHEQKIACRFEVRGTVADYCRAAAPHLGAGGVFACVFPIQPSGQLERVKEGARQAGLAIFRQRPVILREGEPPLLGLFAMMARDDLPDSLVNSEPFVEPPLLIRTAQGAVSGEYKVIKLSIGFPP